MKTTTKATLIAGTVVLALLAGALISSSATRSGAPESAAGDSPAAVRPDSHVLDDGGPEAVTVVEFLDFECEACGAFYPHMEALRTRFEGQITSVVRYFPLPGHANSGNAAVAAEAAAQQGRFEDMYHRLFETQAEWGEAQESRADVFRGFAEELGLDLAAYDAAVADPTTLERVQSDFEEGRALGVTGTPTFFVDGRRVEVRSLDDLPDAIEEALAR